MGKALVVPFSELVNQLGFVLKKLICRKAARLISNYPIYTPLKNLLKLICYMSLNHGETKQ